MSDLTPEERAESIVDTYESFQRSFTISPQKIIAAHIREAEAAARAKALEEGHHNGFLEGVGHYALKMREIVQNVRAKERAKAFEEAAQMSEAGARDYKGQQGDLVAHYTGLAKAIRAQVGRTSILPSSGGAS